MEQKPLSHQSVQQMETNHTDFLKFLAHFKVMLSEQKDQTNLKYLLCRLDFNEYYHDKALKDEEMRKREAHGLMQGHREDLEDMEDDYGMEDEGDDDDDEDDDDEEDDGEDDDDEQSDGYEEQK